MAVVVVGTSYQSTSTMPKGDGENGQSREICVLLCVCFIGSRGLVQSM